MPILFARVAVENTAYHFDKAVWRWERTTACDDSGGFSGKGNPKYDETSGGGAG